MHKTLQQKIREALIGDKSLPTRQEIESRYPKRALSEGAEVTRVCPSPTGFMHIGTVFMAMLCERVAHQSDGVYILRIEDTDKKREVAGAKELIATQLAHFGLAPDEGLQADGTSRGDYGPYVQSERREMYLAYALDLLEKGRAYPCFATPEELQAAVADQQAKKLRPGYYGEWALWRDRSDADIEEALNAVKPFVLRFRSKGSHEKRIELQDALKGTLSLPENDLDVPLIKSDESRLPTYHLAHVVDDYLMQATIIMRGEEWLPSTPLHVELAQALGIEPFRYAHTPVISIIDPKGGGKRKLSKRKDPEADVAFWLQQAYPLESIKAYLMGLANSNYEDWRIANFGASIEQFPFSLEKLASSRSPLLDMKKLEDYAKDDIARMPQEHFNKEILAWTSLHDPALHSAMMADPEYTTAVLAIERDGEKPRKDVAKWSDAPEQFGYFYDDIFELNVLPSAECDFSDAFSESATASVAIYLKNYVHNTDKDTWFEHLKQSAVEAGYTLDRKELKEHPEKYKGGIADFAGLLRVRLTGKTRTPDLYTIMQIMGESRVRSRFS
jgi:glutamyl-tRNA synthetase